MKLLFWLKSYLSRRKQRVVIKDAISSTGGIKGWCAPRVCLGSIALSNFNK
jgi:hypothetical protein